MMAEGKHYAHEGNSMASTARNLVRDPRIPVLSLLVTTILAVILLVLASPPGYIVGDDYDQHLYVRGVFYGTPGFLMLYTLAPVSVPLSLLYLFLPLVPWYPVTLFALIVVSSAVMLTLALRTSRSRPLRSLFAVIVLCCEVVLVLCVTYTAVAFATFAAGVSLILAHAGFERPASVRASDVLGYLLVIVGFSLRPESGLATAAAFSPFLAWALLRNRNVRTMAMAAGVVASMAVCALVGSMAYRVTSGWEEYEQMLNAARPVVDGPVMVSREDAQRVAPQLSSNDLSLMYGFLFVDRGTYDFEAFQALSGVVPRYTLEWFENVGSYPSVPTALGLLVALLFLLAAFVCRECGLHGAWRALALSLPAVALLLLLVILLRNRLFLQAAYPLFIVALYAIVLCGSVASVIVTGSDDARKRTSSTVLSAVGSVVAVILTLILASQANYPDASDAAKMDDYLERNPDKVVVILNSYGELFFAHDILSFDDVVIPDNVAMLGSHDQYAAPWKAFLARNGLDGDAFLLNLLDNDDMVAVGNSWNARLVATYLTEHSDKIVKAERVYSFGHGSANRVWRFCTISPGIGVEDVPKVAKRVAQAVRGLAYA